MLNFSSNKCIFYENINGVEFSDPFIADYYDYLKTFKHRLKITTIETKIRHIHKFWLFTLYYPPPSDDTSFGDYIKDYYNKVMTGYLIEKVASNDFLTTTYTYKSYKPDNSPSSFFNNIAEYFLYLYNEKVNINYELLLGQTPNGIYLKDPHKETILNHKKLKTREKYSIGAGYGLRAKGLMRNGLAEAYTVFSELTKFKNKNTDDYIGINKAFPPQLFKDLLELTKNNPRRRMLYLLCGAYGARISQACAITKYDIDVRNRRVYLTDPRSNQKPSCDGAVFLNQEYRNTLLANTKVVVKRQDMNGNYVPAIENLDFTTNPKLKNLCHFKNAIPSMKDKKRNLYCIDEEYEDMFFETYEKLLKINDVSFPFLIQTQHNTIPNVKDLTDEINKDLNILNDRFPQYRLSNLSKKWHSLRHMFGVYMASIAYFTAESADSDLTMRLPNGNIINSVEIWKRFTAAKMGHANVSSVDVYFNPDDILYELALEVHKERAKQYKHTIEVKRAEMQEKFKSIETEVIDMENEDS